VLAKTLDNILFMRSLSFFGQPDSSNYTMQADVSDGRKSQDQIECWSDQSALQPSLVGNSNLLEIRFQP